MRTIADQCDRTSAAPVPGEDAVEVAREDRCRRHPDRAAPWRCDRCREPACEECATPVPGNHGLRMAICPCKGRLVRQRVVNRETHRAEFREGLLDSFRFPFRGSGRYLLLAVFAVPTLTEFLSHGLGVFGTLGRLASLLVFVVFTIWGFRLGFDVVQKTIEYPERDLEGPDVHDFFDVLGPLLRGGAVTTLYLGPAVWSHLADRSPVVVGALLLGGAGLWPMALLASVVLDGLPGLNPVTVVVGALRTGVDYLVVAAACLVACAAYVPLHWLLVHVPLLAPGLVMGSFYLFLVVQGRLLGNLFRVNRARLAWV